MSKRGSRSTLEVDAWACRYGKSADEILVGVSGATVSVTNDNGSAITPYTKRISKAKAQQYAAEINALPVDPDLLSSGLAGFPNVTFTFRTRTGSRVLTAWRNDHWVQSAKGGPNLTMSQALFDSLQRDFPALRTSRLGWGNRHAHHGVLPVHHHGERRLLMRRAVVGAVVLVLAAGCGNTAAPRRQAEPQPVAARWRRGRFLPGRLAELVHTARRPQPAAGCQAGYLLGAR